MRTAKTLLVFILCLPFFSLKGQIDLIGRITDPNQDPVPYANVSIANEYRGTSTNIDGKFIITVNELPVTLVISHLSYKNISLTVSEGRFLNIKLEEYINELDAVVVEAKTESVDYAYYLVRNAYLRLRQKSSDFKYGKAFYRQKTKNQHNYYELYEIFYDTKYSVGGIADWAVQEGRYALKGGKNDRTMVYNRNFTLLNRVFTTYQPKTDDYLMPVSLQVQEYYDLTISGGYRMEGRDVLQLDFAIKDSISIPGLNGFMLIDPNTYEILRIKGAIGNDDLSLMKLSDEGYWKNYQLGYDITFKSGEDSELFLDYIEITQSFDYFINDEFRQKVETTSLLSYFEHYLPIGKKKLGGRIRKGQRDASILDDIGYNIEFWRNNPIVSRTEEEEDITLAFEKEEAFGSIYLYNRQQIKLEELAINDSISIALENGYELYHKRNKSDNVFVHLDKDFYFAGEPIWFKTYLVDKNTIQSKKGESTVFVELVRDKVLIQRLAILSQDGSGRGEFYLPDTLKSGMYMIRAYSDKMAQDSLAIFKRNVPVYNSLTFQEEGENKKENNLIVEFCPESGKMIQGIASRVAFQVKDCTGRPVELEGSVFDSDGHKVSALKSDAAGVGSIFLSPQDGKTYYATLKGREERYALPEVHNSGYSISVRSGVKSFRITVQASLDNSNKYFHLTAIGRGRMFHSTTAQLSRNSAIVEIPKAKLPPGLVEFTLFDNQGNTVANRVVFMEDIMKPIVGIDLKPVQNNASQLQLRVGVYDVNGKFLNANMSISVVDNQMTYASSKAVSINGYMLAGDNLSKYLTQYALDNQVSRLESYQLDNLILTLKIKLFDWSKVGEAGTSVLWPEGLAVEGVVKDDKDKILKSATINFLPVESVNNDNIVYFSAKTDDKGYFKLENLRIPDNTPFRYQLISDDKLEVSGTIRWLKKPYVYYNYQATSFNIPNLARYLNLDRKRRDTINTLIGENKDVGLNQKLSTFKNLPKYSFRPASRLLNPYQIADPGIAQDGNAKLVEMNQTNVPGYHEEQEFSNQGFSGATVYWNPSYSCQINRKKDVITFKNPNKALELNVIIEGITTSGQPFSFRKSLDLSGMINGDMDN